MDEVKPIQLRPPVDPSIIMAEPKKREIAEETEIQKFDDDVEPIGMVQKASRESIGDFWNMPKDKLPKEVTAIEKVEKFEDLEVERFSDAKS